MTPDGGIKKIGVGGADARTRVRGELDELVDRATRYWLERRGLALGIGALLGVAVLFAAGAMVGWGMKMQNLIFAQSLLYLFLSLGMVAHHRAAKGVLMHYRKVPVCHGFVGMMMAAASVAFILLAWMGR